MTSSGWIRRPRRRWGFAARRLGADPVGLVFAARVPGPELAGHSRPGRVVAEAGGNPLALLELLAAADSSGDPSLAWRAAGRLGLPVAEAAVPAAEAGLAEFGTRVRFRHPLVRSVAYRSGSFGERQQVHSALAEVTDPQIDPDRRAWHRAQARGGMAAAAAFLERSVRLTADPARLVERTLAGVKAGGFDKALGLLVMTEAGRLMSSLPPGLTCCAGRSRSLRAWAATRLHCCSRRLGGSSCSISTWPARLPVPPEQGPHQARHHLPQPAPPGATR